MYGGGNYLLLVRVSTFKQRGKHVFLLANASIGKLEVRPGILKLALVVNPYPLRAIIRG